MQKSEEAKFKDRKTAPRENDEVTLSLSLFLFTLRRPRAHSGGHSGGECEVTYLLRASGDQEEEQERPRTSKIC